MPCSAPQCHGGDKTRQQPLQPPGRNQRNSWHKPSSYLKLKGGRAWLHGGSEAGGGGQVALLPGSYARPAPPSAVKVQPSAGRLVYSRKGSDAWVPPGAGRNRPCSSDHPRHTLTPIQQLAVYHESRDYDNNFILISIFFVFEAWLKNYVECRLEKEQEKRGGKYEERERKRVGRSGTCARFPPADPLISRSALGQCGAPRHAAARRRTPPLARQ